MKAIAVDTETTGLMWQHNDRPFVVSMTTQEMEDMYWRAEVDPYTRLPDWQEEQIDEVRAITENKSIIKVFHNASFDIHMLESIGIGVRGPIIDTLIYTHLCYNDFSTYGLKSLSKTLFKLNANDEKKLKQNVRSKRRMAKKKGWTKGPAVESDYWMADPELCMEYACLDTQRTMMLYNWCNEQAKDNPNIHTLLKMEMECASALQKMESNGIQIDYVQAKILEGYYEQIIKEETDVKAHLGYAELNTRSPKQMMEVFYEQLHLPTMYASSKDNGKKVKRPTANKKALERWARESPLAQCILKIKAANGELSKFIRPLQEIADDKGILHPNYRQCGAVTGRLSCTNPNLQNITNISTTSEGIDKKARTLFIPRDDHILYFPDYSQIEVWIAAYTSKDKVMCEYLDSGHDLHGSLNEQFFGQYEDFEERKGIYRKKIKGLTFATLYGAGAQQLADMGIGLDEGDAYEFISMFYDKYCGLDLYKRALIDVVHDIGYIEDPFYRRYYINSELAFKSLNYMIQGSASGVMKRAIVNVHKLLKIHPGCRLLLTIHDELCIEVPLRAHSKTMMRKIVQAMQGDFHKVFGMPRPFEVGMCMTDTNWAEKRRSVYNE